MSTINKSLRILTVVNDEIYSGIDDFGSVGHEIKRLDGQIDLVNCLYGGVLPDTPDGYDAFLIGGGVLGVNDAEQGEYVERVSRLCRLFDERRRPVMGICLGAQILSHAYGGKVEKLPRPNFIRDTLHSTPAAVDDPVFSCVGAQCHTFGMHCDGFDVPPEGQLLMTGELHRNQIFKVGNCSYAMQPHFEATAELMRKWGELGGDHLLPGLTGQELTAAIQERIDAFDEAEGEILAFSSEIVTGWMKLAQENRMISGE